jgi:SEC-C motif-containing protein
MLHVYSMLVDKRTFILGLFMHTPCPCGSRKILRQCCHPFLSGKQTAPTAEALMRSRFTAFVKKKPDYLRATAADQAALDQGDNTPLINPAVKWLALTIHAVHQGQADDTSGEVHFSATYQDKNRPSAKPHTLEEHSVFKKTDGQWFYVGHLSHTDS